MSETAMMRKLVGKLGTEMFLAGYDTESRNIAHLVGIVLTEMRSPDLPTRKVLGSASAEVRWQSAIDAILATPEPPPMTETPKTVFVTSEGYPLRPDVYPPLPDIENDIVEPAPDGHPWRKACVECLFRTNDPQGVGLSYADAIRSNNLHSEGHFYCVHRTDGEHHRVCASYAACKQGDRARGEKWLERLKASGSLVFGSPATPS